MSDIQIANRFLCAFEFDKHLFINAVWDCGNVIKFWNCIYGALIEL